MEHMNGFFRERRLLLLRNSSEQLVQSVESEDYLEELHGITRTKESTIGAVRDILVGTGRLLFKRGKRIKGAAQAAEGIGNILEIPFSFGADVLRSMFGPKGREGTSPFRYNITRALGSFGRIEKPTDVIGALGDTAHSLFARPITDLIRLVRNNVGSGRSIGSVQSSTHAQVAQIANNTIRPMRVAQKHPPHVQQYELAA